MATDVISELEVLLILQIMAPRRIRDIRYFLLKRRGHPFDSKEFPQEELHKFLEELVAKNLAVAENYNETQSDIGFKGYHLTHAGFWKSRGKP